jgi:hypothetical protein
MSEPTRNLTQPTLETTPITATPRPEPLAPGQPIPKGQELFQYIVVCLDKGCDKSDIKAQLASFGYASKDTETIVNDCVKWRERNAGTVVASGTASSGTGPEINGNMMIGGLICIIGIGITIATFMMSSRSGGTFIVAWGAILFGAVQFVRGAAQMGLEKRNAEQAAAEAKSNSHKTRQ